MPYTDKLFYLSCVLSHKNINFGGENTLINLKHIKLCIVMTKEL